MGNEMTSETGCVATTHFPDDAISNRVPDAVSNNIAVDTISDRVPVSTNHIPGKIMDEDITVPIVKPGIISVKKGDAPKQPTQKDKLNERQTKNAAGGYSFKVCDMNRLRRYIVLGSEDNTYYSNDKPNAKAINSLDNIKCVSSLLLQKRHEEVLETIKEYSLSGRVAKEEPILQILALCAGHENVEIKKAAYGKVAEICNIPTKLFKFVDLTQGIIDFKREKNPPPPQKYKRENERKRPIERSLESLKIIDSKSKEPSESTDTSLEPVKKKKKIKVEPEFKKVNNIPKKSSGWGRMRRKAIAEFYVDEKKDATRLLYLLTKYKQRHNWSHKTVLGYSHPKMVGENESSKNLVLKYCTRGYEKIKEECAELAKKPGIEEKMSEVINYINVIEEVSKLVPTNDGDEEKLLSILKTYGIREKPKEFTAATTMANDVPMENKEGKKSSIQIVREHLPTGFLNSKKVWEALLCDMPMTALIRNLGKMSQMGLFDEPANLGTAVKSLTNIHKLKTARIHPMKVLLAMQIYQRGKGEKGDLSWQVNQDIVKALDEAFYLSFKQPEVKENFKTNKNYMLCLDVSGSMSFGGCIGCEVITPAMASVAMAWVTWNVEDNVELMAFGGHLEDMKKRGFTKDMLINEALQKTSTINFGSTDCSLPMVYALQKKLDVDVFIVYTDSDTWSGRVHPVTALKDYNKMRKRAAKLIVCGMQSNGFTIADPSDPNMMDIVGFDSNVPELISEFAKGNLSGKCGDNCKDCHVQTE